MSGSVVQDDGRWREYLAALPDAAPPDALWLRLQQARSAGQPRSSRWRPRYALAASLLMLAAAGLAWQLRGPAAPLQEAVVSSARPAAGTAAIGLRQLDDELALAYSRNADEAELAALWEARERLLATFDPDAPAMVARM